MAFYSDKSPGDIIESQDWDDFVDFAELISSNAYKHSANTNIHLTATQKTDLTDGGETTLHIHDGRYYTESESLGNFYPSSLGKSLADFSSNTALIKNGYALVSNGDTISHGLPGIPKYANVSPSGSTVNFGATCKVNSTNLIVYLTAPGNRNVFWSASL